MALAKIGNFDDWIDLFKVWQDDIGLDAKELKNYKFDVKLGEQTIPARLTLFRGPGTAKKLAIYIKAEGGVALGITVTLKGTLVPVEDRGVQGRPGPALRSQQFAVAVDAGPISVDERHGVATDRAIRRRSLVQDRQRRQFEGCGLAHSVAPGNRFSLT